MALGGGYFTKMDKTMLGAYINFVSAKRAASTLSARGYAAIALPLKWGADDEIMTVTEGDFNENCLYLFGYPRNHAEMQSLRELFKHATTAYIYKLGVGTKASGTLGTAKYSGSRGNAISVIVEANLDSTFTVKTFVDGTTVDEQTVAAITDLADNDFVVWDDTATLEAKTDTFTGGADASTSDQTAAHSTFLSKVEPYNFNTIGCTSSDATVITAYIEFQKYQREDVGVKFQTVVFDKASADYEGVISVTNALDLIPWVTGAEAGCAVQSSLTNATYDGELTVNTNYSQSTLKQALTSGKFIFHKVGDEVRVLSDINTLTTFTETKGADFGKNQTMRVLDQIGNDIAALFDNKYLGKIPNDNDGRISLWSDIVAHHSELVTLRAIEQFESTDIVVSPVEGDKTAVVVSDSITPINAMERLYMTVYVS